MARKSARKAKLSPSGEEKQSPVARPQMLSEAELQHEIVRILRKRLTACRKSLHRAALRHEEDIEHVHKLRIRSRRAIVAMNLFSDRMNHTQARWIKRRLKEFLTASGEARDLDVLIDGQLVHFGTAAKKLGRFWKHERQTCQLTLAELNREMRHRKTFENRVTRLLKDMSKRFKGKKEGTVTSAVQDWASLRLTEVADQFFKAIPLALDLESIHHLRICGKRFRYAMETLQGFLPAMPDALLSSLRKMQERLGGLQDHVIALKYLEALRYRQRHLPDITVVQHRVRYEAEQIDECVAEFHKWMISGEPEQFRHQLSQWIEVLSDPAT